MAQHISGNTHAANYTDSKWDGKSGLTSLMDKLITLIKDMGKMSAATRKVRHGGKNFIGHFPSIKTKKMIGYESLLERDLIYLLDFEADVIDFEEQPFAIPINRLGHRRRYTPDFLVLRSNGKFLVEVKPERFVDTPENTAIFLAAVDFCNKRGWIFRVVTEDHIRMGYRLTNVKLLAQFARHSEHPQLEAAIIGAICSLPPDIVIGAILERLGRSNRNSAIATILKLAYFHKLKLPLDNAPITLESLISLPSSNGALSGSSIMGSEVGGQS